MKILVCLVSLFALSAEAQYEVVKSLPDSGQPAMGVCGQPLPLESSRNVMGQRLVCGGAMIGPFNRVATKTNSDQWDAWQRESQGVADNETRARMQQIRLAEAPIQWSGQAKFHTYETWSWQIRKRGRNPQVCRVWQQSSTCTKHRSVPVYKEDLECLREQNEESNTPSPRNYGTVPIIPDVGSGYSGSAGQGRRAAPPKLDWDSHPSDNTRGNGPNLGRRQDPGRLDSPSDFNRSYRGGGGSGSSGSGSSNHGGSGGSGSSNRGSGRRTMLDGWIIGTANASEACPPIVDHYRDEEYQGTCYTQMVDECEWEETHNETRACPDGTIIYNISYNKPDASWAPGKSGYYDILPNKYDLLPGEWETLTLTTNNGQSDKMFGRGRAGLIKADLDIDEPWNTYQIQYYNGDVIADSGQYACQYDRPIDIKAKVTTVERIVREAPNTLSVPKDSLGKERPFDITLYHLDGQDDPVRERPDKMMLKDESTDTVTMAARLSRKFEGLDPQAVKTAVKSSQTAVTIADNPGFYKSTMVKVRLIQEQNCFGEPNKVYTDTLATTSKFIRAEDDKLVIPLDGSQGNVPSLYQPIGYIAKTMERVFGKIDMQFQPGAQYDFQVSTLQEGMPFYKNGCKNGSRNCDMKDVNPEMFSKVLHVKFVADPRVDRRSWLQKWDSFYSRKLWNKPSTCR